jgi:hypothetical protein
MRITEPTTMLTDYALAALGVWFGWRLVRGGREAGESSRVLWGASFLAMAMAAVAGGTAHGFAEVLGEVESTWIWKLTTFSIGLASAALLAAAAIARLAGAARVAMLSLVVAKLAVYLAWMSVHDEFRFVIYDYAPSMVAVVLLLALPGAVAPVAGAGWATAGVAVSFAAAAVQASGFTLHRHFNHNDLYHVIQMGGLYLLYRGGALLRDRRLGSEVDL